MTLETDDSKDAAPTDETIKSGAEAGARKVNRKQKKGLLSFRNVAAISILVVGCAVAIEAWRNPELIGGSRVGSAPNLDVTPAGDQLETSERYADNLNRQNEQGAQDAIEADESFIATPDQPLRDIDTPVVPTVTNENRPLPPANANPRVEQPQTVVIERSEPQIPRQSAPATAEPAPNYNRINQLAQLMSSQQQGLNQAWQAQPSGVTVVIDQELYSVPEPIIAAASGVDAASSALSVPSPDLFARAGDVVLASTIITNDSDTPGPVVVEVRRGPLSGARLIGGFQANSNNTHLIVQFNQAILPNGTQVPISAYAVDARQTSLAVRTDLDRRIFERYAPRVAAAFVTGLGSSLSDPGTSLIDLGGVTGVTRPEASFEQGVYSGIAQVGNDLAQEFVQSAPTGPLISLRARQAIGVLFTSNVEQP